MQRKCFPEAEVLFPKAVCTERSWVTPGLTDQTWCLAACADFTFDLEKATFPLQESPSAHWAGWTLWAFGQHGGFLGQVIPYCVMTPRLKQVKVIYSHCCLVVKSCPILCDPMNWSQPGSSVYGILQARILEWVDISSSKGSVQLRDRTLVSCTGRQIRYQRHQGRCWASAGQVHPRCSMTPRGWSSWESSAVDLQAFLGGSELTCSPVHSWSCSSQRHQAQEERFVRCMFFLKKEQWSGNSWTLETWSQWLTWVF